MTLSAARSRYARRAVAQTGRRRTTPIRHPEGRAPRYAVTATSHHADKRILTGPQLAVLRWIADGCPDGVFEGYAHRQNARALENRSLVRIWGHGKTWHAELTEKGRGALGALAAVPSAAESADLSSLDPSPVDELLERLIAAGGVLDVGIQFTRDQLQAFRHAALTSSVRPDAQRLPYDATDGWAAKHFRVFLTPYFEDTVELAPVPVPERVGKFHPLARRLRENKEAGASREHLTRAVRILHALATEAERRGMHVTHPSSHSDKGYNPPRTTAGDITIERDGDLVAFELRELPPNRSAARPYVAEGWRGGRWNTRLVANQKFTSAAVLQLAVSSGHRYESAARYRDGKRARLEELLPALLRDVELAHLYATERRAAAARAVEERRQKRREQLERATAACREDERLRILNQQVAAWQRAAMLREYALALRAADDLSDAASWPTWILQYADVLDPTKSPVHMPQIPEPTNEQVAQKLGLSSAWALSSWLES